MGGGRQQGSPFYPSSSTKDAFCFFFAFYFLSITYCFKVWHKGRAEVHFRVAEPTNPGVKELKIKKINFAKLYFKNMQNLFPAVKWHTIRDLNINNEY